MERWMEWHPLPRCHSPRTPSVIPPLSPPLSFPQVFSGNPWSFSFVPFFVSSLPGENAGFPIKNVGNDRTEASGITDGTAGITDGMAGITDGMAPPDAGSSAVIPTDPPLSFPRCHPLCHSHRFLAGIHGLSLLSLSSCALYLRKMLDSRLKMSGMTERRYRA